MSKPQRQFRFLTSTKHIFEIEVLHSVQAIAASLVVAILTELRHVRTRQTFGNERNGVARVQSCFECLMQYSVNNRRDGFSGERVQPRNELAERGDLSWG